MTTNETVSAVISYLRNHGVSISESQESDVRSHMRALSYSDYLAQQKSNCTHPSTRREVVHGVEDECEVVCLSCGKSWREYW